MKLQKKIIVGVLLFMTVCGAFVGYSALIAVGGTKKAKIDTLAANIERLKSLNAAYADGSAVKVNENDFADFDVDAAIAEGVRINRLRYMATHNSYKTATNKYSAFLYKITFQMKKYSYTFDTVTDQLNAGLRSFELDIHAKTKDGNTSFECTHFSTLDSESSMLDIATGLAEIKAWSDYNAGHLPLFILVEPKDGSIFAGTDDFTLDSLDKFQTLLTDTFGDKLLTVKDMLGGYDDFDAMRTADAYPTIADARGKVMFLLHDSDICLEYVKTDGYFTDGVMIPILKAENLYKKQLMPYTFFALQNKPTSTRSINSLTGSANMMVRTRLDKFLYHSDEKLVKGLSTGANILSTDYPPPASLDKYGYVCELDGDGHTILLRR